MKKYTKDELDKAVQEASTRGYALGKAHGREEAKRAIAEALGLYDIFETRRD